MARHAGPLYLGMDDVRRDSDTLDSGVRGRSNSTGEKDAPSLTTAGKRIRGKSMDASIWERANTDSHENATAVLSDENGSVVASHDAPGLPGILITGNDSNSGKEYFYCFFRRFISTLFHKMIVRFHSQLNKWILILNPVKMLWRCNKMIQLILQIKLLDHDVPLQFNEQASIRHVEAHMIDMSESINMMMMMMKVKMKISHENLDVSRIPVQNIIWLMSNAQFARRNIEWTYHTNFMMDFMHAQWPAGEQCLIKVGHKRLTQDKNSK